MMTLSVAVASAALAAMPAGASAALLAHDDYDYTVGKVVNNNSANPDFNGGFGWANSWSSWDGSPSRPEAGSLTFGNLATSGNHFAVPLTGRNRDGAQRELDSTVLAAFNSAGNLSGVSRWISLIVRPEAGVTDNFTLSFSNSGGGGYNGPQKIQTSGGYYGFNSKDGFISSGVAVSTNPVFLVFKIDFIDANHTNGTLYVNPTPGLAAPDVTGTSHAIKQFFATAEVSQTGAGWAQDELRLGETYQDVAPAVPEPTALAGLGVALPALALRRRRR